jgi:hypothetical protein
MAVHLADWGLRQLTDEDARRRDAVLILCARLWRDGIRFNLPVLRRNR